MALHLRLPHPFSPSTSFCIINKPCFPTFACNAAPLPDAPAEDKDADSEKRFAIRVPALPNFADIDAARLALESAFHALSFEVSKLPIESALQGLSSDILKFLSHKQVFIFDITALVPSKLRRQAGTKTKGRADGSVKSREIQHPRCAWPRTSKAVELKQEMKNRALAYEEQVINTEISQRQFGVSSERPMPIVYPHCKWPREPVVASKRSEASSSQEDSAEDVDERIATCFPSTNGSISVSSKISSSRVTAVGPMCGWPRSSPSPATGGGLLKIEDSKIDMYPGSTWTGNSRSGSQPSVEQEGGARCAWPRVTITAGGSDTTVEISSEEKKSQIKGTQKHESVTHSTSSSWPKRMLATSVGLSLMNQFFLAEGASALASPIYLLGVLASEASP